MCISYLTIKAKSFITSWTGCCTAFCQTSKLQRLTKTQTRVHSYKGHKNYNVKETFTVKPKPKPESILTKDINITISKKNSHTNK